MQHDVLNVLQLEHEFEHAEHAQLTQAQDFRGTRAHARSCSVKIGLISNPDSPNRAFPPSGVSPDRAFPPISF